MEDLTPKQALKCLDKFANGCNRCQFGNIKDSECRIWEAGSMAIEALRNQVNSKSK